ncbi:hypothetical protein L6452_27092 [Arctium lappa]|uniref:Uncharacterized protein n=1 Tax=Arctium lappa TaxID=4217 RepID=A0ACB8ZX51_ARCLA|nr:hypothetical protein L6452_27092 [Arctium lappa]
MIGFIRSSIALLQPLVTRKRGFQPPRSWRDFKVNLLLSKWMRELEKVFYGKIVAYDTAMNPEAKPDELQNAIWKIVFSDDGSPTYDATALPAVLSIQLIGSAFSCQGKLIIMSPRASTDQPGYGLILCPIVDNHILIDFFLGITTIEGHRPTIVHKQGLDILHDPWFNKRCKTIDRDCLQASEHSYTFLENFISEPKRNGTGTFVRKYSSDGHLRTI